MTEDIFNMIQQAAKDMAVSDGVLIEEDGTLLNPNTIKLVSEIERVNHLHLMSESNRQGLIDIALESGNKTLFMKLTN